MRLIILLIVLFVAATLHAQTVDYTAFNPTHMKKEYFVSTNSGITKTPIGIKVGYICDPGLYLSFRYGEGTVYNSDSDLKTVPSKLFSIVGGITKPLIIKDDFKVVAQLGIGYGEWWDYRWEGWAKSGIELEAGLMFQKNRFLVNMTGNVLVSDKTFSTGDLCLGVGYVLNKTNPANRSISFFRKQFFQMNRNCLPPF